MVALLRGLPDACRPVGSAFGSHGIGALREREWNLAAARTVAAFEPSWACLALESAVGSLGAAAGAANVVYGLAVHRHGAWPVEYGLRAEAPLLAWAISPDGTRGLAVLHANRTRGRATEAHRATWEAPRVLQLPETPANDAGGDITIAAQSDASLHGQNDRELDAAAGVDPAPVAIDAERGAPVPIRDRDAVVVAGCLERMALLSQHRDERPWRERSGIEARLLAQVDAIVEARVSVPDLLAFWNEEADEDPRVTWAVVFVLGSLAGRVRHDGVASLVSRLPDEAEEHARMVAEALIIAPHPDRAALGHDLRRSALPLARAVAVDLLSRLGQLGAEAALAHALGDHHAAVKAAALRTLVRLPEHDAAMLKIRACLGHDDPAVAWEAARAHGFV